MSIVDAGFDLHRTQITFDALDRETGEVSRGRLPATPAAVRAFVARFPGRQVHVAVEAGTGWYFVWRALTDAGAVTHLADPAETRAARGPKRRAKTDRQDALWLRTLLVEGRLPESRIPPEHILELRTRTRLRATLVGERTAWLQRIRATLFHLGIDQVPERLRGAEGQAFLAGLELPAASAQRIGVAARVIATLEGEIALLDAQLRAYARAQTGCRALMRHFGVGELTAPTILAELGDPSQLRRSRAAVRLSGLDIGVERSDRRARPGRLTRQGAPGLRWALYESAQSACRPASPDHAHYQALRQRGLSHTQACLTVARKLARRCYHTLRELGPAALAPVAGD